MRSAHKCLTFTVSLAMLLALACGCGNSAGPTGAANANTKAKVTAAPTPTPEPPQKVFIDGAKDLLCTDVVALLTGKEDGYTLLGMPSDFLNFLNTGTGETTFTAALSDAMENGKPQKGNGTIELDAAHDSATGDSSLEVSLGSGSDTNMSSGVYITGGTAQFKGASAKNKAILYQMPALSGKALLDEASGLLTGLLSDDGKAVTPDDNLKDRQDLTARYLDPWMTDTQPDEYTDAVQTRTLCGKAVQCRVITLNMQGQRAYDFVLGKMQQLGADAQFKSMDEMLGGLMYFLSTDVKDISKQAGSKTGLTIDAATKQLADELNGLTPDEIAAAKFIVSVVFDGGKAIGIEIEASTTDKAFKLNLLLYRNGSEHQLDVYFQSTDGASATLDLSKVKSGDDTYAVSGQMKLLDPSGEETCSGQISGTTAETANEYDLNGTFSFGMHVLDTHNKEQEATFGGGLAFGLSYDRDTGYTGTGTASVTAAIEKDTFQFKAALKLNSIPEDSVIITPPKYIPSKAVTVTDAQGLYKALGGDWKDVSKNGKLMQALAIIVNLITD